MTVLVLIFAILISTYGSTMEGIMDRAVEDVNERYFIENSEVVIDNGDNPIIEVVFVLDATGSMTSLIEGAKRKIWSIANKMMTGDPTPDVKIGLVVYRDRGDEFVVKGYDLTDDIDEVYSKLIAVRAQGGGDFQEDVNRALSYAVDSISWSESDNVLKMIFLVGDADPHMDYNDEEHYPEICKAAIEQEIVINAIRCGNNSNTEEVWKEIAHLAEGHYTSIDYSTTADVPTPYDDELASLSSDLYGTVLLYGSRDEVGDISTMLEVNKEASEEYASTAADRSINAAARAPGGTITKGDLLGGIIEGEINLNDISDEELPEVLKDMSESEREVYIDSLGVERQRISDKIAELSHQRDQYIKDNSTDEDDSFDSFVVDILMEKAEKINVRYED